MSAIEVTPVFVDWITATGGQSITGTWLQKKTSHEVSAPTQRAYHRSHAVQYYPSGWRYYYTPDADDEPCVLVVDGNALANIRRAETNDYATKTVAQIARATSKFTRIDLTVDFVDQGKFAKQFYKDMSENEEKWPAWFPRRKVTLMKSGGTTVYVGSRQSPLMMRLYDKHRESKGVVPTSRLELEVKGHLAGQCHNTMKGEGGWLAATSLFNGMLRSLSYWEEWPTVERLLYGEVSVLDKEERERDSDKKEWLKRQVLPTFVREPREEAAELWAWFQALVEQGTSGA